MEFHVTRIANADTSLNFRHIHPCIYLWFYQQRNRLLVKSWIHWLMRSWIETTVGYTVCILHKVFFDNWHDT